MLPAKYRRAAGHGVLVLLSLASLLALTGLPPHAPTVVAAVAQGGEQTFYVDWHVTASGQRFEADSLGGYSFVTHSIAVTGSAVVHRKPGGPARAVPFQLTVTEDFYQLEV